MGVLDRVRGPRDLRSLTDDELTALAAEIRDLLVGTVARNGGHLGPNLGVVELTIAAHRVFDSPTRPDRLRHRPPGVRPQAAHRPSRPVRGPASSRAVCPATRAGPSPSTTGSRTRTPRLRCRTPTGWPRRSPCVASGTGTVVAVVGDGALTGGMAWEALNNIAGGPERRPGRPPSDRHRRQRQRPLVLADGRRAGRPPGRRCAPTRGYELVARRDQAVARPHAAGRAAALRRAARHQEGPQGRAVRRRACSRTSA